MDLHGYRPCDPNEGSQNPPPSATTSAEDHSGVRTTNQSVYYPTMQHNLPHMSRQMTQYDLFPNFNPGSLAFNHFMYNLNQGQGHYPYESQMNPMSWGSGLQSNLSHSDDRGSKYVGNGPSADFEVEPDQMNRTSNFQSPSPLPHTVSSPNVNSFVYPISAFSSNGRTQQKRPRKHSTDNSDNSDFPGTDIMPPTTQLPSFSSAYLQEMSTQPSGSGLGYLNQTRNGSNHSAGTPDRLMATRDDNIDPGRGQASCMESKLDTSVNLSKEIKGIYDHSEKDGLISNSDSDGGLSGEDSDQDLSSSSLTFKVEMESNVSSDEEVENSESDESSHTDPYSSLTDQESAVKARMSSEGSGRKRLWKNESLGLSSGSSVGERPSKKVTKHHVKLDRGGNEVSLDLLPIKLTSEARATQGIDVPIMEKNLSKTKKKPGKAKTGPAVKKKKRGHSDVPVVSFVDKYFYCGHCSCEFRNCEIFLRHYVAYHDDFFPKLLRKVYTLQMLNYDIEEAMSLLLECKICETFFATEEERTMHLNSIHKDVKWQCLRCGLEFGVLHEWNDHLLYHRPDQKYKCLSCNEEFDSVRMATEHYKGSHDYEEEKPVYDCGLKWSCLAILVVIAG
ncbi:uncharacterized protein LOC135494863 isoform X2 [Lineus longissimus]|uniref:uncharacterized protein LOC135494863 isoform X2 n=1 Tax=Lineus longissimus TaxID=88925 RepID=UPI00315D33DA